MTIEDFIKSHDDFDCYKYKKRWNEFKVYSIWLKENEGACIGYPQFALEKDGEIREASTDEVLKIMGHYEWVRE